MAVRRDSSTSMLHRVPIPARGRRNINQQRRQSRRQRPFNTRHSAGLSTKHIHDGFKSDLACALAWAAVLWAVPVAVFQRDVLEMVQLLARRPRAGIADGVVGNRIELYVMLITHA